MTEQEFHNQRKAFAIINDKLHWCPYGLSHYEWLVTNGLLTESQFDNIVRGYIDDTGIYFYQGDFQTNQHVEDTAKLWYKEIDTTKPVYCGVQKGKIGERWKPIKQIAGW